MKSSRKHDLQSNELAAALTGVVEKARPHSRLLGYAAVGVAVLFFFLVVLPLLRGRGSSNPSADAFVMAQGAGGTQALSGFLKEYGSSAQAPAARLLLAERLLTEAVRGDVKSNPVALVAEDKDMYTKFAQGSSPEIQPLAKVGLAMVALQDGDMEKGRAGLKEVVEQYPSTLAAAKAGVNLARLAGYKPIEFSNDPPDAPKAESKTGAAPEAKSAEAPKAPPVAPPAPAANAETKSAETPKP